MSDVVTDIQNASDWFKADKILQEEMAGAYEAGRQAERARILDLIGNDEVIKERNCVLDECADDWEKGRNRLRQQLRDAIKEEK